jgi:hypothetical protein
MKKALLLIMLVQFTVAPAFSTPGGDRNRFYLMAGSGYASAHPAGLLLETGVELRLFGNIHARIVLDHYFGSGIKKESETVKHINGITLYVLYKMRVTETIDFRLKAGGHYTSVRSEMTVLGLTFTATKADIGISAGAGFSVQLGNKVYLYAEAAVKHLLLDEPWTWVKGEMGVMYRLR